MVDGRKESGLLIVCDADTDKVRLMYKITFFEDMTPTQLDAYGFTFSYMRKSTKFNAKIKHNYAMTAGVMGGIGYRAAMEPDYNYGTYAVVNAVNVSLNTAKLEEFKAYVEEGLLFHAVLGWQFLQMCSVLFRLCQQEAKELGLPLVGLVQPFNATTYTGRHMDLLFTPQVAYTYSELFFGYFPFLLVNLN